MELDTTKLRENYIPVVCKNTDTILTGNIRLLLLGNPGSGKTTASLTFPNPIIMDFDNQLSKFKEKKIPYIPFQDTDYITQIYKTSVKANALLTFLRSDGKKLSEDQTIVIDSLTTLNIYVEEYARLTSDEKDKREMWGKVKDYYVNLHVELMKLKCNVVVCAHLSEVSNASGLLLGYKPLVGGATKQSMGAYYTDIFKQVVKEEDNQADKTKIKALYQWQIHSDDYIDCKTSLKEDMKFVEADYNKVFKKK